MGLHRLASPHHRLELNVCGICGVVSTSLKEEERRRTVRAMCNAQIHRGPDGEGFLEQGHVALGMRRLSIIDIPGGDQPVYNEDRNIGIVFNGEIYNYRELREELAVAGHRFATRSDTEVIVHAYEQWGSDCVHYLRGMFAFAVLDWRRTRVDGGPLLFLARDRLGIKPLYWFADGDRFVFASEVRALLASGLVPRRLSPEGVASYLSFGSVQEPVTLLAGVYSLAPGHHMTLGPDGTRLTEQYWNLPAVEDRPAVSSPAAFSEAAAGIRGSLTECISQHMRSDVPFGAFLSSGIDSTAVVALMAAHSTDAVRTFTIAFDEQAFNEAAVARRTAERFGTAHSEILVRPAEVLRDLPAAIAAMDQPTVDGINTYYVSRAAKNAGVTVVLSGLGGDEIFAGYPSFRSTPRLAALRRAIPARARRLLRHAPVFSSERARKLRTTLAGLDYFEHPYFTVRALFTPDRREALWPADSWDSDDGSWTQRAAVDVATADQYCTVNATSYLECRHYLPSTLLRDADSMSMAHSLELRVPLLDHVVVERAFRIPGAWKLDRRIPKPLLVAAMGDLLPREVVYQRKRTFTFPWREWLRGELRPVVEARLSPGLRSSVEVFDPVAGHDVWTRFLRGQSSWSRPWSLYVLAAWADQYLT